MKPEDRAHDTWTIIAANDGFSHQEYFERQIANAVRSAMMEAYEHAAQVAYDIESGKVTSQKTVAQALQQLAKEVATT